MSGENRRDPKNKPRENMVWSDLHGMWVDKDTRSPETKARHEKIAADAEKKLCGQGLNREDALELLRRVESTLMENISYAVTDRVYDMEQEKGKFTAEFRRFGYNIEWELKQIVLAAFRQWPDLMCEECGGTSPHVDCPRCGNGAAK